MSIVSDIYTFVKNFTNDLHQSEGMSMKDDDVAALRRGELESEYIDGDWIRPDRNDAEPWALVTYAENPSPETGHQGWCWWAMGKMGDAPTFKEAQEAAVAELWRLYESRFP